MTEIDEAQIEIVPLGGREIDVYLQGLTDLHDSFANARIRMVVSRSRCEPIASTLLITIGGSILSHYLIKLIDLLVAAKKSEQRHVTVILVFRGHSYELPRDEVSVRRAISEQKAAASNVIEP